MNAEAGSQTNPSDTLPADAPVKQQKPYALIVVSLGLIAAVVVFALAIIFMHDNKDAAGDIVQVTAPAFAMIAGIIGGYFGVRAGSLANQANADVEKAKVQGRTTPRREAGG